MKRILCWKEIINHTFLKTISKKLPMQAEYHTTKPLHKFSHIHNLPQNGIKNPTEQRLLNSKLLAKAKPHQITVTLKEFAELLEQEFCDKAKERLSGKLKPKNPL